MEPHPNRPPFDHGPDHGQPRGEHGRPPPPPPPK
jgi:hypothetical protein